MASERLFSLTVVFWAAALIFYVLNVADYVSLVLCTIAALAGYFIERVNMFGLGRSLFRIKPTSSQETVVANGATFTGDIHLRGTLRVYGRVIGNIEVSDGCVYVMGDGEVEGEIKTPCLVLNGLLKGACKAITVNILAHGCLQGDCHSTSLSVVKGGILIGHSLNLDDDNQTVHISNERVVVS